MVGELKINNIPLPRPDSDLEFVSDKVKTEYESEAGTTLVSVRRESKLTVSGSWTLTGAWMERFRAWAEMDTVTVEAYFPRKDFMTAHECQMTISSERHIRNSRGQLGKGGLYQVSVKLEEL